MPWWRLGPTWEPLGGQVSQGPEHVTHQSGTAGTGLGDGGEDLLDVVLQVLLHTETAKTRLLKQHDLDSTHNALRWRRGEQIVKAQVLLGHSGTWLWSLRPQLSTGTPYKYHVRSVNIAAHSRGADESLVVTEGSADLRMFMMQEVRERWIEIWDIVVWRLIWDTLMRVAS